MLHTYLGDPYFLNSFTHTYIEFPIQIWLVYLSYIARDNISTTTLCFPVTCRIFGLSDFIYAIHRNIAMSGMAQPEISIMTSVPIR